MTTINEVKNIVSVLTQDEQQLLKDTIRYGSWGDAPYNFLNENGEEDEEWADVYITNDAKEGGHFSGRQISAMFRSIYSKLCPSGKHKIGKYISHASDWWG